VGLHDALLDEEQVGDLVVLNGTSIRDGDGSNEALVASFMQQRRAERHAAAECQKGATYGEAIVETVDKKAVTLNPRLCLNSGAFGDVYKTVLGGSHVALKQQDISPAVYDGLYVFRAEVKNQLQWPSDYFVQMTAAFETKDWGFIALELANGDLDKALTSGKVVVDRKGRSDIITTSEILSDLVPGLVSMHEAGWAHRDLKLGNIMYFQTSTRLKAKLGDLGLACQVVYDEEGVVQFPIPDQGALRADPRLMDQYPQCTFIGGCGSVWAYMPPEHLVHTLTRPSPCTQYFPMKSDVWMLGVMLAKIAGIEPPTHGLGWAFTVANEMISPQKITSGHVSSFGSAYATYARSPAPLPTAHELQQRDTFLEANGCLRALLTGMLKPLDDRMTMAQVNSAVAKWAAGEAC